MLDIQYTLEKLAEYRELGHDDYAERVHEPLSGERRLKRMRHFLSVMTGILFGG